jgi:hypothetical protein
MQFGRLAVAALFALTLSTSCANRLLVKGLTLPPGSIEKEFSADTSSMNPLVSAGSMLGGKGQIEKAVMISFDNPAGWDKVAAHVDGQMKAQGFADPLDALSANPMVAAGMGDFDMSKWMRSYDKSGSRFSAMLMNNDTSAMMSGLGSKAKGMEKQLQGVMPGAPGQFTLYVIEYKGD